VTRGAAGVLPPTSVVPAYHVPHRPPPPPRRRSHPQPSRL